MSVFLIVMFLGMVGLGLMAIPGIGRGHGVHAGMHTTHGPVHVGGAHGPAAHAPGAHASPSNGNSTNAEAAMASSLRWFPSPRMVFSLITLFGAFGFALESGAHLHEPFAALIAIIPAVLVEKYAVTPAWNSLMQFEGKPSSPLEELVMTEAEAVTPFRNGKGMVTVIRDERAVQLLAHLRDDQKTVEVHVGDKLVIEQVDSQNERVTVSICYS